MINNNHCLSQCSEGIDSAYGDRPGKREEIYKFREVNFARIAQEMGCLGLRVEQPGEIAEALRKALEADAPAVVEVITDEECKAPDPWTPVVAC